METNLVDYGIKDISSCVLHNLHACLMDYAISALLTVYMYGIDEVLVNYV